MSGRDPSAWQGPLRAAAAVLAIGFLVVWLVKPIGDPCPDLASLPQGSTASSSPSFSPPGARTCTYTVGGGTEAKVKHVPWLDWIVLALLAAAAAGAVRFVSPAGRRAREEHAGRPAPRPGAAASPRDEAGPPPPPAARRVPAARRAPVERPRAGRPPSAGREPKPERPPRKASSRDRSGATERDAADRERARQERAARDRARRDG